MKTKLCNYCKNILKQKAGMAAKETKQNKFKTDVNLAGHGNTMQDCWCGEDWWTKWTVADEENGDRWFNGKWEQVKMW